VLDTHVFGNRVAAPRAAAQRQRRGHVEVVKVAQSAVGGGGIHDDAAGLHPGAERVEFCFFGVSVQINRRGVAVTTVGNQLFGLADCIFKIFCAVHRQQRGKLFVCEFFRNIDAFHFAEQNLGAFRNGEASQSGNFIRILTDDLRVDRAVD